MTNQETISFLSLHSATLNTSDLLCINKYFRCYQAAASAPVFQLCKAGLTKKKAQAVVDQIAQRETVVKAFTQHKLKLISWQDAEYPELLRQISDPPAVLYVRGELPRKRMIALVGTRRSTEYGRAVTVQIAQTICRMDFALVSGLAYGVDSIAQSQVVKEQGSTVAVLAGGLDSIYPPAHVGLAEQIVEHGGCIISEYPLFCPTYPSNFLERNRIIAGLSEGTIVIEAPERSGSLNTCRLAVDYNRDVFAVPGSIYSEASKGPNRLIAEGAYPLISPDYLLQHYGISPAETRMTQLSQEEVQILASIPRQGVHINELSSSLALDITALSSKVVMLEIKGAIENYGAGFYRRVGD